MGLLFGSDDSGCTAHHWGEYTTDWQRTAIAYTTSPCGDDGRVRPIPVLHIELVESARCQHDGCHAEDVRDAMNKQVPMNALVDAGEVEDLTDMFEMLDEYWNEEDEDDA